MAVLGILLMICAGAYLADVAVTNSLGSQLDMFGTTVDGLTNAKVFLLGAAAGFVLAAGLALTVAGLARRSRTRRRHRDALAQQRAETERLAAQLERERAGRQSTATGYAGHDPDSTQQLAAPQSDDTAVVYPAAGATATDDPSYRRR